MILQKLLTASYNSVILQNIQRGLRCYVFTQCVCVAFQALYVLYLLPWWTMMAFLFPTHRGPDLRWTKSHLTELILFLMPTKNRTTATVTHCSGHLCLFFSESSVTLSHHNKPVNKRTHFHLCLDIYAWNRNYTWLRSGADLTEKGEAFLLLLLPMCHSQIS